MTVNGSSGINKRKCIRLWFILFVDSMTQPNFIIISKIIVIKILKKK